MNLVVLNMFWMQLLTLVISRFNQFVDLLEVVSFGCLFVGEAKSKQLSSRLVSHVLEFCHLFVEHSTKEHTELVEVVVEEKIYPKGEHDAYLGNGHS